MAFGNGLDPNFSNGEEVMSEINMTPLVDVMLVLLVIFMITMPLLNHSVKIDLPRAENLANKVEPETITLSITADGGIHWNDQPITSKTLAKRLQSTALQQPQPEVHLRGDRLVDYEHVVKVMTAVQRSGILKLGFVTEPDV